MSSFCRSTTFLKSQLEFAFISGILGMVLVHFCCKCEREVLSGLQPMCGVLCPMILLLLHLFTYLYNNNTVKKLVVPSQYRQLCSSFMHVTLHYKCTNFAQCYDITFGVQLYHLLSLFQVLQDVCQLTVAQWMYTPACELKGMFKSSMELYSLYTQLHSIER